MSSIRPLPYKDVIKRLRNVFRRATGESHEIRWNEKKRKTCVVPHHKEIKAGTLRNILKQADVPEEKFLEK